MYDTVSDRRNPPAALLSILLRDVVSLDGLRMVVPFFKGLADIRARRILLLASQCPLTSLHPLQPSPDSLVPSAMLTTRCPAGRPCHTRREIYAFCFPWPHDLVSLGVVERFPLVSLAVWHSLTRTSSRNLNKVGLLPSRRLCCPAFFGSMSHSDSLPADGSLRFLAYRASFYEKNISVQGRVSPVHCILFHTMPIPIRRRILRCRSKYLTASLAFVQTLGTRLPLFPHARPF